MTKRLPTFALSKETRAALSDLSAALRVDAETLGNRWHRQTVKFRDADEFEVVAWLESIDSVLDALDELDAEAPVLARARVERLAAGDPG